MRDDTEAMAIARSLSEKRVDVYEMWLEPISGPGLWCPLCKAVVPEGKDHDMREPMTADQHKDDCEWARAKRLVELRP